MLDYDCIGFTASSIVKYNMSVAHSYVQAVLNQLVETMPVSYSPKICEISRGQDIFFTDLNSPVIWDLEHGTILKINETGHIIEATLGYDALNYANVVKLYGSERTYKHLKWPLKNR